MFRGFSTLTCPHLSIDEFVACAKNNNMHAVEIRLDNEQKICGLGADSADVILNKLGGLKVTDLGSGISAAYYKPELITMVHKVSELAAAVGAPAIRVFVGGAFLSLSSKPDEDYDGIVRFLREAADAAKGYRVKIWAETHSSFSGGKPMAKLVQTADNDNIGVIWDVIHSIEVRETVEESAEALGSLIEHIHLKDGRAQDNPDSVQSVHTALGKGTLPLKDTLAVLNKMNYNGCLSLEWELPWRPELKDCYKDTDETLAAYNEWLDANI